MPETSWKESGTQEDIALGFNDVWINPSNAAGSDNAYAVSSSPKGNSSNFLRVTNFGFTDSDVPSGSSILGIEIEIERHASVIDVNDHTVRLVNGGSPVGDNKASGTDWATSEETVVYGGAADTWNAGLTQSSVTGSTFGVQIGVDNNNGSSSSIARVDNIRARITYFSGEVAIEGQLQP